MNYKIVQKEKKSLDNEMRRWGKDEKRKQHKTKDSIKIQDTEREKINTLGKHQVVAVGSIENTLPKLEREIVFR